MKSDMQKMLRYYYYFLLMKEHYATRYAAIRERASTERVAAAIDDVDTRHNLLLMFRRCHNMPLRQYHFAHD